MSLLNKLVNYGSKFILVMIGLTIALIPIIYIFANETLHHQSWNPGFEKYLNRLEQIKDISSLQFGYIFLSNSTYKGSDSQVQGTLQLADYICYNLLQNDETVVRKNLEIKIKRKTKKGQEIEPTQEVVTVTTLLQNPPLAFLKKQISKFINFEHQSLKSKHWVIASFGELQGKIQQQIETIKQKNPQYKFTIVSPKHISPISMQKQKLKPDSIQLVQESQQKRKNKYAKGKKNTKVLKVKVIEEETKQSIQIPKEQIVVQQNDL